MSEERWMEVWATRDVAKEAERIVLGMKGNVRVETEEEEVSMTERLLRIYSRESIKVIIIIMSYLKLKLSN